MALAALDPQYLVQRRAAAMVEPEGCKPPSLSTSLISPAQHSPAWALQELQILAPKRLKRLSRRLTLHGRAGPTFDGGEEAPPRWGRAPSAASPCRAPPAAGPNRARRLARDARGA